ncbi:hypothetical protein [Hydrogenophaga sp.]|uniref:hypothetical protein n=1 Tax=Hydrogenophaga sp. TaxID=1904254 RepID=UPI0027163909|nr:hypothetical protein [Hydrogenophaga sp.]MDO9437893.1 hypothetical protein [Hydrogenophaga sp.]
MHNIPSNPRRPQLRELRPEKMASVDINAPKTIGRHAPTDTQHAKRPNPYRGQEDRGAKRQRVGSVETHYPMLTAYPNLTADLKHLDPQDVPQMASFLPACRRAWSPTSTTARTSSSMS